MNRALRRKLVLCIILAFLGGAIGFIYGYILSELTVANDLVARSWSVARAAFLMTLFAIGFELFVYQAPSGAPLRRKSFIIAFGSRLGIQFALIVLAIYVNRLITILLFDLGLVSRMYLLTRSPLAIAGNLLFALAVGSFFALVLEVRAVIGDSTFNSIVLGRYHRPRREQRGFLFADVKDSSVLAEQIGGERYQALLGQLFFALDEIVVDLGGEVHAYVGDLMIATWRLTDPKRNARALTAALRMHDYTAKHADDYRKKFSVAPQLWVALHGGEIVTGEYGGSKRQITYFGEAVNVTARMETLAKQLNRDLVVSKSLLAEMALPPSIGIADHGEHELRGIKGKLGVCSIGREETPKAAE